MFSAVLVLALAFDQKVTIRVGEKPDSVQSQQKAASDTIDEDKGKRRQRKRVPVTPELEASAFKDPAARARSSPCSTTGRLPTCRRTISSIPISTRPKRANSHWACRSTQTSSGSRC